MVKSKADIDRERLIEAALSLTVEDGWLSLSMSAVAARANVDLADCYHIFPDKASLVVGLLTAIDHTVLQDGPADAAQTPRDRLFEILMRRFDALQPHRDGIQALIRHLPGDPLSLLFLAPYFRRSMAWMLEAAGLPATGLGAELRIQGVAVVFLTTLRTWMADDSPDLSPTMAALDRALKEAEGLVRRFPQLGSQDMRWTRPSPASPSTEASSPPDLD